MTQAQDRLRLQILDTLQQTGPRTRAELARDLFVARGTISSAVLDLLRDGLLEEPGDLRSAGRLAGRPGSRVSLRTSDGYVVGIDFGRLSLRVGLSDLNCRIIEEAACDFDIDVPAEEALDIAAARVEALMAKAGIDRARIHAVGVGVPGPVDERTGMLHAGSILATWVGTDVPGGLSRRLALPVFMDNDANLGALAETAFGAAAGVKVVLYVLLSIGVGLGIVLNGQVFRGASGIAGELGHIVTDEKGAVCRCGSRGCLEAQISIHALCRSLRASHGEITTDAMLRLAAEGDIGAVRVVADAGTMVGRAVGDLCNYFNPDLILVGGELMRAGPVLLGALKDAMHRFSIARATENVRVEAGALGERAELIGTLLFAAEKARRAPARPEPVSAPKKSVARRKSPLERTA